METKETNPTALTIEELEILLAEKKKAEVERQRREREQYEKYTNDTTENIVQEALKLEKSIITFHTDSTAKLREMREKLNAYGAIRSNSKGGYHRVTAAGTHKVVYKYSTVCVWDERAEKAEALLRDFLSDFIKKRDMKLYNIIAAILERNEEGKLEYARIQSLYSREDEFDDPRWKEAIRLFKQSYYPASSKMYIEVYRRSESDKWMPVKLNLSSI
jgi:hypothetical protein